MSLTRRLLLRASRSAWLARTLRRRAFFRRAVRRFLPGEHVGAALDTAAALARDGIGSVLTQLGEQVTNRDEAAAVRDQYLRLLDEIRSRDLPAEISVKLTHLGLDVNPKACLQDLLGLAARAAAAKSFLWTDLEGLLPLAPAIRVVKGAYNEPPDVAFPKKRDVDAAYAVLAGRLLERAAAGAARVVLGTHDLDLIERLRARALALGVTGGGYEVHMLYGIRAAAQRALAQQGVPVRVLISYGTHWFPWYMRRLAERPANVWFVVKNLCNRYGAVPYSVSSRAESP